MALFLGESLPKGSRVELPVRILRRHFVALGAAGSGKTVLCKCLVEEAVRKDIPVLIVDPQGDIASLALRGDLAELDAHGTPLVVQEEFFTKARVAIFTPASRKGIPLSANPLKFPPPAIAWEAGVHALDATAGSLASFLDYDLETPAGRGAKAYLAGLLEYLWEEGQEIRDFGELASLVKKPPREIATELREYVPGDRPTEIARRLHQRTTGAAQLMFQMGAPIDMAMFLDRSDGRVPVNVVYLNTLTSGNDKQFFVANLLREVYLWMLRNPAEGVQLLLYVDEISPYIPPYPRNPPPKEAYQFLFKQARKYGLGLVAATQNVTDIDYKALAQVNTWCLGRMMARQELKYVERIIRSIDPLAAEEVLAELPSLRSGEFLMLSPDAADEVVHFRVRWLATEHRTLDDTEVPKVLSSETRAFFERYELKGEKVGPPSLAPSPPQSTETGLPERLRAAGRAMSPEELAETSGTTEEQVRQNLQELKEKGVVDSEPDEGGEDRYFPKGAGFRPAEGISGEVQVIPLMVPQVEALKRARRLLGGGLFSKDEEVVDARFSYLPLWRVEASKLVRKLLVLQELEYEAFYLHAQTGALLSREGGTLRFERLVDRGMGVLRDLDDDPDVMFQPELPGSIENFPKVRIDLAEASRRVERTFGARPGTGELVLLPVWTLTVRHKDTKSERIIAIDGATGRILVGEF